MDETPNAVVENKENLSPSKLHLYRERHDYKDYKIGARKEPPVLIKHVEITGNDTLEERLNIDLVLAMTANLKSEDVPLPPLGSWTVFNSRISTKHTVKSDLDFLPVVPYPPNDSILKDYLDFLIDLKDDLKIDYIFCHCDQDVFYKLSQIIWKEKNHQHNGRISYPFSESENHY